MGEITNNTFFERLQYMCELRNTKLTPLLVKLGISKGAINRWRDQGSIPNGETLLKLADELDCTTDYLLGRVEYPELKIIKPPPESGVDSYAIKKNEPPLTSEELRQLREDVLNNPRGNWLKMDED